MNEQLTTELRPQNESTRLFIESLLESYIISHDSTTQGPRSFNEFGLFTLRGYKPDGTPKQKYLRMWSRILLSYNPSKLKLLSAFDRAIIRVRNLDNANICNLSPTDLRLVNRYRAGIRTVFSSGFMLIKGASLELDGQFYADDRLDSLLRSTGDGLKSPVTLPIAFVKVDPALEGNRFMVVSTLEADNPDEVADMIVIGSDRQLIPRVIRYPFLPSADSIST